MMINTVNPTASTVTDRVRPGDGAAKGPAAHAHGGGNVGADGNDEGGEETESAQSSKSAGSSQPSQPADKSQSAHQSRPEQSAGQAPQPGTAQQQPIEGERQTDFKSALMRSIPEAMLERIAAERGGIDPEILSGLDAVLRGRGLTLDAASQFQMERFEQWLKLALDNPHMLKELAERIPVMGARETAGQIELIGKLCALLLPKGVDVEILPGQTLSGNVNANINTVNLIELLCKTTFSAIPTALLELIKQVNSADSAGININNVQLPSAEAQKLISDILNKLPEQAAQKPELLHDPRQLSTKNLDAEIVLPQKSEAARALAPVVSAIRAEYPALTEAAVRMLLGGGGSAAAPALALADIGTKVDVLMGLVNRIGVDAVSARNGTSVTVEASVADKTFASIAAHRAHASDTNQIIDKTSVIDKKAGDHRSPLQGIVDSSINNKSPVIDKPPIADKPSAPNIQTIRHDAEKILNALKTAIDTAAAKPAQSGGLDAGGKLQLLSLVRDTISSLDDTLRPLTREERPVPPEFYERVASAPKHQISTDTKSAVFTQIAAVQESIRRAVEVITGAKAESTDVKNINTKPELADSKSIDTKSELTDGININTKSQLTDDKTISTKPELTDAKNINTKPELTDAKNINTKPELTDAKNINTKPELTDVKNINTKPELADGKSINIKPESANIQSINPKPELTSVQSINTNPEPADANSNNLENSFLRMAQRLWTNTEKLRAGFQEAFSSLDLQSRVSPLEPADKSASHIIRQSVDALRTEILLDVSKALREIFSSVEELRETVSRLSGELRMLPEAEEALARAARSLEREARRGGTEVMERMKDVLKELSGLQADVSRARGKGAEAGGAAARAAPADVIRSTVLAAARNLESLQLLSAQTRGMDIQQQLIALPVKIGGEWTEVQVKLIRDRGAKEKKAGGGGRVSVYLNVAPSRLGQVSAHLDFNPPASLKLAFQFEKPSVTKWFREQAGELREALARAGLPGAALEFRSRPAVKKAVVSTDVDRDAGTDADKNVTVNTGKRKTGRVDFKA